MLLLDDLNIEAYEKIATAYLNSGNLVDAIEYAKKALEISTKVPQVYIMLADVYSQLELNFEKSIQILDEGISENPNSAELWAKKGDYNFSYDLLTFYRS